MSGRTVRLGYELVSGTPVDIPIRHLCVCGQTQEAGKTTTLEALISRSELRALTFITKRGEGAFEVGNYIAPYFREQADWRFVSSLLEAFLGERMKFERSWIMRASKGARTLADVRRNVSKLQTKARGLSADVYMVLGEYLDELVPAIAAVTWAARVELAAGVNVMDLTAMPGSMQQLVIKSALEWVLEHEHDVVVVVPEAWKFIPQGRGTPVKLAAASFIRQGAALGNYLWLDSQDLGGIEKEILRSVPVWLLGVQRESNEIKRTLSNIPASIAKPKAGDIATLEIGQFIACWGKHAIKTYVWPVWVPSPIAAAIALGHVPPVARSRQPATVGGDWRQASSVAASAAITSNAGERPAPTSKPTEDFDMTPAQEKKLDDLVGAVSRLAGSLDKVIGKGTPTSAPAPQRAPQPATEEPVDIEQLYQTFKARLIEELPKDPRVMEIVVSQPELRVRVKREVVEVDGDTLSGRLARLLVNGYFDEAKSGNAARVEMASRGWSHDPRSVYRACDDLTSKGFLRKGSNGYQVVESMKRHVVEAALA